MKTLALIIVVLPLAASAATITVNSTGDDTTPGDALCTLREAIANVNAAADTTQGDCTAGSGTGDTIDFSLTLPATITLTTDSELEISADVTIRSPGRDLLALDGNAQVDIFNITAGTVNISELTIQNGLAANGGAVSNHATLTLTSCTLSNNSASGYGAGIYNGGNLSLGNSMVIGNLSTDNGSLAGGGIYNYGTLTATNCTLGDNAARNGGGLYNDANGAATLSDCALTGNKTP